MVLQRLNTLVKKNTSGIHSSANADNRYSPNTSLRKGPPSHSPRLNDLDNNDLADFGAKLERCKGPTSKENLPKRNKLYSSLRSLRSMAALHSSPGKTKRTDVDRDESPTKHGDLYATPLLVSPSLALLHFEQSPADKPILELNLSRSSLSKASLEVQHSSPLSVPHSTKQTTTRNIFPPGTDLPAGTVPDTPTPLQRAFDRDPANYSFPWRDVDPTPTETYTPSTPILTPLPGTNMSVGDVDPEFVPLPPSINASTVHLDPMESSYFDIPVNAQWPIDNADMLNGIPGPYFAGNHGRCVGNANASLKDADMHLCADSCSTPGVTGYHFERAKSHPYTDTPDAQDDYLHRMQQTEDSYDAVRIENVAQHYRTLPIRLKHNIGEHQGRIRKDSVFNKDRDACDGSSFAEAALAQVQEPQDSTSTPVESRRIVPVDSQGSQNDPAKDKTWGGNSGLYDGSGYGEDSSGPATPHEPDEGVKDVHMLFNPRSNDAPPATRRPNRRRCGQKASLPEVGRNDPHSPGVSELAVHKQHDHDSLESMYSMYALSPGDKDPNSSGNSVEEKVQRPASWDTKISS